MNDTHTIKIKAYEGTSDKRAWYRTDKKPEPLFGDNANLSAGVSIILRSRVSHTGFIYSNRVYSDQEVFIEYDNNLYVAPNPVFNLSFRYQFNKEVSISFNFSNNYKPLGS